MTEPGPSKRLIEALARGETTVGGLAEAGWFVIGTIAGNDIYVKRHESKLTEFLHVRHEKGAGE